MEQIQQEMANVDIVEQLARREQQLEQLRLAYVDLQQRQQQNHDILDRTLKNVNHLPVFTGVGDVTVNSFFSGVEYLISTLQNEEHKKEVVRAIYYKTIQGEAKNSIINIPEPDNWKLIKDTLKLRYKPDTEPHQIYRRISNLRVNTVSELIDKIQKIKYKTDELIVYYNGECGIDLTNIDSLLVNTIKEMTQGTLLDKIYEQRELKNILYIMNQRRFEDTCIRPEYKTYWKEERHRNQYQNKQNIDRTYHGREAINKRQYQDRNKWNPNFYRHEEQNGFNKNSNNNSNNNSGRYRFQNNVRDDKFSGQFQQLGNSRPNSNQVRWNRYKNNQPEPMEIDNVERNYNDPQVAGHPNHRFGQNRLNLGRQSPEGPEINNTVFLRGSHRMPTKDKIKY